MKKHTIASFLLLAFIACKDAKQPDAVAVTPQSDTSKSNKAVIPIKENMNWSDSLIVQYINQSQDETMVAARKDTIPLTWMLDSRKHTDTAEFLIYQLGHSYEDRFMTDTWLYIDSLTKAVYEYDLPADSLIRWVK